MDAQNGSYDLIVVGLGAVGSATLFHASKSDARVLGIDRYNPPHDLGSTNAETRITRLAVGEGPQYLPFVARSHRIWSEITEQSGVPLYHQSGGCIITPDKAADGDRWNDFARISSTIAADAEIDFELLSPAQTRARYPQINVGDHEIIGYEPTGGVVMAEKAVETQLRLARNNGASIITDEIVTAMSIAADGSASLQTASGAQLNASSVVVATGPWFGELATSVDRDATYVTRQVAFWFEPEDPEMFQPEQFPFIIWVGESEEDYLGAFPMPAGGIPGMKILTEQFVDHCDPSTVNREITETEVNEFYERFAQPRIAGLTPTCVKAVACLYTMTADEHFLIDTHPRSDRVMYASPCSGHGFKHSTAIGEALAQRLLGGSSVNSLEVFGRARLAS